MAKMLYKKSVEERQVSEHYVATWVEGNRQETFVKDTARWCNGGC